MKPSLVANQKRAASNKTLTKSAILSPLGSDEKRFEKTSLGRGSLEEEAAWARDFGFFFKARSYRGS